MNSKCSSYFLFYILQVQVHELADVLCRIQGITPASAANPFVLINNPLPVPTTLWGKLKHKAQDLAFDSGRKAFSLVGKASGVIVGSLQRQAGEDKSSSTSVDGADDIETDGNDEEDGDEGDVEDSTREEFTSPRSFFGSFLQAGKSSADTATGRATDGTDKIDSPSRISYLLGKLNPFGGDGVKVKKEVIGIMPPRKEIGTFNFYLFTLRSLDQCVLRFIIVYHILFYRVATKVLPEPNWI